MCLLRVFGVYNKVADLDDVVIQERDFSIAGTHELATAMPLSPFCFYKMRSYSHRNGIFVVECRRVVRQFVTPGILLAHHIKSVSTGSHLRDVA